MRLLALALAATLLPAALATSAEPGSGKVSSASPSVSWTGTLVRPYGHHLVFYYETQAGTAGQTPCDAPACDTFTLEVADGPADLALVLSSEQTGDISLRIQHPDGSWTYHDGWSDGSEGPQRFILKKAASGTYTINVVARVFGSTNPTAVDDTAEYKGTATLAVAKPPAPPAVVPVTPAAPAPPPASKPASKKSTRRSVATCKRKAKRIKNAKKRRAAIKRCAKKRR